MSLSQVDSAGSADVTTNDHSRLDQAVASDSVVCTADQTDSTCKLNDESDVCTDCPVYSTAHVDCPADKEALVDYSAVDMAAAVEGSVNHRQSNTGDTRADGSLEERQHEEECADAGIPVSGDSSEDTGGHENSQLEIDCISAASVSQISAENEDKDEPCVLSVSEQRTVTQPHSGTVDGPVERECSSTEVSYGSGECSSAVDDDASPLCLSVSTANKLSAARPDCDDASLMEDLKGDAWSESSRVLSNDDLVTSSSAAVAVAVAEGHCVSSVSVAHSSTASDSKCLSIMNPSLAQANQFNTAATDRQLHAAEADRLNANDSTAGAETDRKSDTVTLADTDGHSSLCSKSRYIANVDVSMLSSSFCTQPLKSLADLVQKVSVSPPGGTELLDHVSKKNLLASCDAETILDATTATMRNSPLYSARVNYMSARPPGRNRRAAASTITAALQQTVEQNSTGHGSSSEFKKPSPCTSHNIGVGSLPRRPVDIDQNGDVSTAAMTGVSHQPGTSGSTDVDGIITASVKHRSQLSPVVDNSVDSEMLVDDCVRLTNDLSSKPGRKDRRKSQTAGRCKNRVQSCKVDVVDVKLLKDFIVACSGDGVATSCRIVPDGESIKTSTVGTAESLEQNKSTPTLGEKASSPSETVKSKLSAKKQRKGAVLHGKTTKVLSDNITLIDVAAVKSCVEKDYSEFIKSIQQSPGNKTAVVLSKGKKKKKRNSESGKNLAVVEEEIPKKGCSSKNRHSRKTVDKKSDECAELKVKSTRSKSKKRLPQKTVDSLIVDGCRESSTADGVSSICDESVASPTGTAADQPHDFTVPNSLLPTPKKSTPRKKKKSGREKKSEVIGDKSGTETRSHRKAATTKTRPATQVTAEQQVQSIEVELTGNSATVLNAGAVDDSSSAGQVISAERTKKSRPSKKKSSALLDSGGGGGGGGVDHCQGGEYSASGSSNVVSGKSRKRKSPAQSSLSASDMSYEPALKNSKSVASVDKSSLETVESAAEPCLTESNATDAVNRMESSRHSPSNSDAAPAQRQDQHQPKNNKRKNKKAKTSCVEVIDEASTTALHEKILEQDSQTKIPASQTVADVDIESGLDLTVAGLTIDDQTATAGKAEDETGMTASEAEQNNAEPSQLSELATLDESTAVNAGSCLDAGRDDEMSADEEQKLFACAHCIYRARKKGQLRKHLSVHKVFDCAHCDFTADTQAGLDDHMSVKHPSRCGRRLCKRCHMLFRAGKVFADHVERCTGVKLSWQCPVCGKDFKFISAMRTHLHRWHGGGDTSANDVAELTSNTDDDADDRLQLSNATDAVDASLPLISTSVSVQSAVTLPASGQLSAPIVVPIVVPSPDVVPIPTAVPVLAPRPVPTEVRSPTVIPSPASEPVPHGAVVEPVDTMPAGNSVGSVKAVEPSTTSTATTSNSSTLQSDPVLLNHSAMLPGVAAELGNASGHGMTVSSTTQPGSTTGHKLDLPSDIETSRVNVQADGHSPTSSSSLSVPASTVTVDGELRYLCQLCPKSFKAKRSMVHHRRMIHEGGRLRKREAAAAAAGDADDDGEKMKMYDEHVTAAAGGTEGVESGDVDSEAVSSQHAAVELPQSSLPAQTDSHPAADAGPVRRVYSCSFAGCCHKFKRPGQLHRHEEKHAGPGAF